MIERNPVLKKGDVAVALINLKKEIVKHLLILCNELDKEQDDQAIKDISRCSANICRDWRVFAEPHLDKLIDQAASIYESDPSKRNYITNVIPYVKERTQARADTEQLIGRAVEVATDDVA